MNDLLRDLLQYPECDWLEWKSTFSNPLFDRQHAKYQEEKAELLRDLCSLANSTSSRGAPSALEQNGNAFLVFGVKDQGTNREITGIRYPVSRPRFDDANFQEWSQTHFEPRLELTYCETEEQSKDIGIFSIRYSANRPHFVKRTVGSLCEGQVWHRLGTRKRVAGNKDLRQLLRDPAPIIIPTSQFSKYEQQFMKKHGDRFRLPLLSEKELLLQEGWEILYWPGTRKEIHFGTDSSHIAMLKPL